MMTVELVAGTWAGEEMEQGMVTAELVAGTWAGEEMEVAAAGERERETIKMVTMAMSYNMD